MRRGKIYSTECRVPENSKDKKDILDEQCKERGKQQNGRD